MGTFFLNRPVFAAVISIVITLFGVLALNMTPVTLYPDINPPTVTVSATYTGATAAVVANTVTTPLEQRVNGVEGMEYMTSNSNATGSMSLNIVFKPGTDIDKARAEVQNRVNQVTSSLPEPVRLSGVTVTKSSETALMYIAFYSSDDRYDPLYLGNYVNLYLLDQIKRIPGANSSSMFPSPDPVMRIWLQPEQMMQRGVTTSDIGTAIRQQNKAYSIGAIGESPAPRGTQQTFGVTTRGMMSSPAEFEKIILRTGDEGSAIVRLKDVARAEVSGDSSVITRLNGKQAVVILINQQVGTNAVQISRAVRSLLQREKPKFPVGMDYTVVLDTSTFTSAAIDEVKKTFWEAVILVVVVVFLFLQSVRATLIPILAVPIAIIGTFIGIYFLDFSVNMFTLFGLILAIGLVVDDAIIVVEKVEENMADHGMPPLEATRKAMQELTGSLIAIVLVLGAVFAPVTFLSGGTGILFRQFAVTITISMVLSGVVALTLSPALASRILTPGHGEKRGFFRWFDQSFNRLTQCYLAVVRWLLRHRAAGVGLFGVILVVVVALWKLVPTGFVPDEDMGMLGGFSTLTDTASLERTTGVSDRILPLLRANPAVRDVLQLDGYGKSNMSSIFISLKPYEQRTGPQSDAFSVGSGLMQRGDRIKEAFVGVFPINPLQGGSEGFEFYIQSKGNASPQDLERIAGAFKAEAGKRGELSSVRCDMTASQQQLFVDVDRERADLLGIDVAEIYGTMETFFASTSPGQFVRNGKICYVKVQADAPFRDRPDDLEQIYIRSRSGEMIPLSALATFSYVPGPAKLSHFNGFPAVRMSGAKAPGVSSGTAIAAMEDVARTVLPEGYGYEWAGQELEEKKSANTSALAFAMGLLMVFLILAAQYESWTLPIGVVLSVPFAVCGALLFTLGFGLTNDVFFKVGLLTLIGLSAKNAILIIHFAAENVRAGMPPVEAALEAARLRFRPIVMTSLAFILGCVPMAVASGAGANSQHAIGTGVIGGMFASTLVASCFVPLFFVLLEEASALLRRHKQPAAAGEGTDHA